jgi:hypothetical protein
VRGCFLLSIIAGIAARFAKFFDNFNHLSFLHDTPHQRKQPTRQGNTVFTQQRQNYLHHRGIFALQWAA